MQLLEALELKIPTDRKLQTGFRIEILEVLKETGDAQCVPPIVRIIESDASVAEEARSAITAISRRCPTIDLTEALSVKPTPPKRLARTGDLYVDECLASGLEESYEPRDASSMEDVKPARILGSGFGGDKDVLLAQDLICKYPDFDMPYYWLSHHYLLRKDLMEARAVLDEGIQRCRRKRNLCYEYGCVEKEAGRLPDAVKWWTRDAVLQLSSETWDGYGAFMYLGYVAQCCGLRHEATEPFQVTDAIRSIRLNSEGQQRIHEMVQTTDTGAIVAVINSLLKEYR